MARNLIDTLADNRTFGSLGHRNYRLLWIGTLISHSGDSMDHLALNWLILELTDSPFYLGMANLSRAIPFLLLTLIGGAVADRVERRKLLFVTQSVAMLLAFLLGAMLTTGVIQVWMILALAALRGATMSFNLPARQTIISDLVPRQSLANAIALNSVTNNITKIIGPSLAGVLIAVIGTAGAFYINGISFLAVLWTLHAMELPLSNRPRPDASLLRSLGQGFSYMKGRSTIWLLVMLAVLPTFFGMPYQTMLAVFARDELAIGSTGLGILTSAAALGAIVGALALASLHSTAPRGKIMLVALIGFGALLIMFSYSTWAPLSALLLVGVGSMHITYSASNNTILQLNVPDEFRGRVMSTLFLSRGLIPLGTALAGTLAALVGVRATVSSMAAVIVFLGILAAATSPSLRRLK